MQVRNLKTSEVHEFVAVCRTQNDIKIYQASRMCHWFITIPRWWCGRWVAPVRQIRMEALLLWTWAVCQPIWRLVKWIKMAKFDRNYGKSPFSMGKFTISYYFDWAIFNSYVGWRKKTADFFVVNFNRIPGHFFFTLPKRAPVQDPRTYMFSVAVQLWILVLTASSLC